MNTLSRRYAVIALLLVMGLVSCGKKGEKVEGTAPQAPAEAPAGGVTEPATTPPTAEAPAGTEAPVAPPVVVSSPEGKFTLTLPSGFANPNMESVPVTTDAGQLTMTTYMAEAGRGLVMFSFLDYPETVFASRSVAQMLDGGRDGALQSMKATLEKQEDFKYEENQGRSIFFNLDDQGKKAYGRIDYLVVKPRLYQVGYLSHDQAEIAKADVQGYFKSFQLMK
ncbi:MAG: hypothetical protein HY541_06600 [Deltaproteobacteria bacterium]|nr:hypothetical protein [Deltaproteobacteria bacterium]